MLEMMFECWKYISYKCKKQHKVIGIDDVKMIDDDDDDSSGC